MSDALNGQLLWASVLAMAVIACNRDPVTPSRPPPPLSAHKPIPPGPAALQAPPGKAYAWLVAPYQANAAIARRIKTPTGFQRRPMDAAGFGHWLRFLPLKAGRPPVLLHSGIAKVNQQAHVAVVDLDVGKRNLQQCADAVIRLRAEYLYGRGMHAQIRFNYTSGDTIRFERWARGHRPVVSGRSVSWRAGQKKGAGYAQFRAYLTNVFTYAGTASLSRELQSVRAAKAQTGDVLIQGGFPGHAVILVDQAEDPRTGERIYLLAQSYMPAQELHVLKNPARPRLSPWYRLPDRGRIATPEWNFDAKDLKRFESAAGR